jgi:hypothetical protein
MPRIALEVADLGLVHREAGAGEPDQVLHPQFGGGGEDGVGHVVAVAQVVVGADGHAVAQARPLQGRLDVLRHLVPVGRVVAAGADRRRRLAA